MERQFFESSAIMALSEIIKNVANISNTYIINIGANGVTFIFEYEFKGIGNIRDIANWNSVTA